MGEFVYIYFVNQFSIWHFFVAILKIENENWKSIHCVWNIHCEKRATLANRSLSFDKLAVKTEIIKTIVVYEVMVCLAKMVVEVWETRIIRIERWAYAKYCWHHNHHVRRYCPDLINHIRTWWWSRYVYTNYTINGKYVNNLTWFFFNTMD